MDGDEAPLTGIVELAERYDAMVMVDEAHATGIFGGTGAGVVNKYGLGDRVFAQMGTLGKALGGFGAYVAGSQALRELLINRCRSFIFTTALPPAIMAMAIAAIDLIAREPERRERLWENCRFLSDGLKRLDFGLNDFQSPILPLIIGGAESCMQFSQKLLEHGVFVQGIRPPTVPPGTSRLRITVMATHSRGHMEKALEVFQEIKNQNGALLR
jgi:glycine C-acetyltransferase/8-amino-7-oxononanoate synthase